jgi:hypothetical protein
MPFDGVRGTFLDSVMRVPVAQRDPQMTIRSMPAEVQMIPARAGWRNIAKGSIDG